MHSVHNALEDFSKGAFAQQFGSFDLIGANSGHHAELLVKVKARNVEDVRLVWMGGQHWQWHQVGQVSGRARQVLLFIARLFS